MEKEYKSIEIKGREKDLREYFHEKQKDSKKFHLFSDWSVSQKKWGLIFIVGFILIMIIFFAASSLLESYNHKNYLTSSECNQKLDAYMKVYGIPWYERLFYQLIPFIPWIALAWGLGWIIHGVGFRII